MKLRSNPKELEILGNGKQTRSYIYIDDAIEATMIAWRKTGTQIEVYNVGSKDWITVDEVADVVIDTMDFINVKKVYKPMLHGVGWPGDVKRIALRIDRLKQLGFTPKLNSRESVKIAATHLLQEISKEECT